MLGEFTRGSGAYVTIREHSEGEFDDADGTFSTKLTKNRKKILIVDDKREMCILLGDFLKIQGFETSYCTSGESALRVLQRESWETVPSFDLVISDVRMGEIDGIALLREIKKHYRNLPVVLFTGAGCAQERVEALSFGATEYFFKPFSLSALKTLVETTLF